MAERRAVARLLEGGLTKANFNGKDLGLSRVQAEPRPTMRVVRCKTKGYVTMIGKGRGFSRCRTVWVGQSRSCGFDTSET